MSTENDITKTGSKTYKELQEQNKANEDLNLFIDILRSRGEVETPLDQWSLDYTTKRNARSSLLENSLANIKENGEKADLDYWGNSFWDKDEATISEWEDLNNERGKNQWTIAKWGAGLFKGAVLAGTTFADGVGGFICGIGRALSNIGNENESGWETFSRIWNNDFSNAMQDINEWAEKFAVNYKTNAEANRAWYQNLGSANFWADSVLKNMGFMVGAFYGGGFWTKGLNYGLKGLSSLKGIANGTKGIAEAYKASEGLGTMGSRIIGSTISAVNEGRIEANQLQRDNSALQYKKAADALGIDEYTLLNDPSYANVVDGIDESVAKAATIDFGLNIPILALNDCLLYGKLYSRGFSSAKDATAHVEKGNWISRARNRIKAASKEGQKLEAIEKSGIFLEEGKYAVKELTTKGSLWGATKSATREGFEELHQQFASNLGGNLYTPDSPDAYYEALNNPEALTKGNELIASVCKSFNEAYLDPDQYEQFAVGAISSLIGMPTFGKKNNADANTWLKLGPVGFSGGVFGNIKADRQANKEAQKSVTIMNETLEKLKNHQNYFALSNVFTDAMNGYSAENDKFEFKNAEASNDFAMIQAFSRAGRMDDLKKLVGESFSEKMSADELGKIALYFTKMGKDGKPISGWTTPDGKPMATVDEDGNVVISEENQAIVRKKLKEKQETTLKQIEAYEKALNTVRGIGNNALTDEQNQELAWLLWKGGNFKERYGEIIDKRKGGFENLLSGIDRMVSLLDEEAEKIKEELEYGSRTDEIKEENRKTLKENKNIVANLKVFKGLINSILDTNKPYHLAEYFKNNPEAKKLFTNREFFEIYASDFQSSTGMSYAEYMETIKDLVDCTRLANAYTQFDERYKEFVKDPLSIIERRRKKKEKQEKKKKIQEQTERRDQVNNSSIQDLVKRGEEQEDLDDIIASYEEEGVTDQSGREKAQKAKAILDYKDRVKAHLDKKLANKEITQQQYDDAIAMLNNSVYNVEDAEELKDLSLFSYDSAQLDMTGIDPSITPEELNTFMEERKAQAKNALADAIATVEQAKEDTKDLPETDSSELEGLKNSIEEDKEEGHDATSTIPTENERIEGEIIAVDSPVNLVAFLQERLKIYYNIEKYRNFSQDTQDYISNVAYSFYKAVKNSTSLDEALDAVRSYVESYHGSEVVFEILRDWYNETQTPSSESNTKNSVKINQEESSPIPSANEDISEQQKSSDDLAQSANNASLPTGNTVTPGSKLYWNPATSEVAFGEYGKSGKPFWQIAEEEYKKGSKKYTPEQIKRWKAIYEYLQSKGAFENAFHVKEGDEVQFVVDPKLNEEAGSFVVLLSVNGKIVGDLATLEDHYTMTKTAGLRDSVIAIQKEYEEWQKSDESTDSLFTSKKLSTKVSKKMVGRVIYTNQEKTLNEIHTEGSRSIPFKLGVVITKGGQLKIETGDSGSAMLPLHCKKGQPFLLLPTGNPAKPYFPVAIRMREYGGYSVDTNLDTIISKVLTDLKEKKYDSDPLRFIRKLQELLYLPKAHLDISKDGHIKFRVLNEDGKTIITFEGDQSDTNFVEKIAGALKGTPYQINTKFINKEYMGYNYNELIGEIATANLPVGFTHPISSWFTMDPIANSEQQTTKKPTNSETNVPQEIDLTEKAIEMGLIRSPLFRDIWGLLSKEQQKRIIEKGDNLGKSILSKLVEAYDGEEFEEDPDSIIDGTRNRLESKEENEPISIEKETAWLEKVLPNLSSKDRLKIVKGLIKIANSPNGAKAWGQFKKGIIYLSDKAAKGTLYHEAFHAVVHTLLSVEEVNTLFNEAVNQYGDIGSIALEEKLAEDFRRYVQLEERPVTGVLTRIFRTLKHFVKSLLGKENIIENTFYRIQRGQFANRTPSVSEIIRNRLDTYDLQKKIESFDKQYEQAKKEEYKYKNFSTPFKGDAWSFINQSGFSDVLIVYQNRGRYRIGRISEVSYKQKREALEALLNKTYTEEMSEDMKKSEEAIREQEAREDRYEEEFREYYREKHLYGNLSQEDKDYLRERGISEEEYNKMTPEEREVLFRCKW